MSQYDLSNECKEILEKLEKEKIEYKKQVEDTVLNFFRVNYDLVKVLLKTTKDYYKLQGFSSPHIEVFHVLNDFLIEKGQLFKGDLTPALMYKLLNVVSAERKANGK